MLEPHMDPSACSVCGRWIRRCRCPGRGCAEEAEAPSVWLFQSAGGILVSLPTELALMTCEECSLSAIGALAQASKQLRQLVYTDELWVNLRAAAPWAGSFPGSGKDKSARLAVRREVELERQWRSGRCSSTSELPLQRCRAHEKMRECVGCMLTADDRLVLTGEEPPTL